MKVYGVNSRYDMYRGVWKHGAYIFETTEIAERWLHTETKNFMERELFRSREDAEKLCGKSALKNAFYYDENGRCFELMMGENIGRCPDLDLTEEN